MEGGVKAEHQDRGLTTATPEIKFTVSKLWVKYGILQRTTVNNFMSRIVKDHARWLTTTTSEVNLIISKLRMKYSIFQRTTMCLPSKQRKIIWDAVNFDATRIRCVTITRDVSVGNCAKIFYHCTLASTWFRFGYYLRSL
jgi:hypothetical protein